jgi:hypothetical protein
MMRDVLMAIIVSVLLGGPASGATVYSSDFEPGEQGAAFTPGILTGQGTPPWSGNYFGGGDSGGTLVDTDGFLSSQSLRLQGYRTSRLTLDQVTRAAWLAFAFRPDMPASIPGDPGTHGHICWMRTTRGGVADVVGIYMTLNNETGRIMVEGVDVGPWTNHQWHTIAFFHQVSGAFYTGSFDIYLNGSYAATVSSGNAVQYNGLQTIVFSSAGVSAAKNGDWLIDGVYMGDEARFQTLQDCPMVIAVGQSLAGDISADCYTNEDDLRALGSDWLQTNDPAVVASPASSVGFEDSFPIGPNQSNLDKWTPRPGNVAFSSADGNPPGSMHIDNIAGGVLESYARADFAESPVNAHIIEFDVKLNEPTSGYVLLMAAYSSDGFPDTAEMYWDDGMYYPGYYGPGEDAWDFGIFDDGWVPHTVDLKLRADQYHHFVLDKKGDSTGDLDLWVDGTLVGTYNPFYRETGNLSHIQVGSVWGAGTHYLNANWDNFSIRWAPRDCAELLALGGRMRSDLVSDCNVNLKDFVTLADDWMRCVDPADQGCENFTRRAAIIHSDYLFPGTFVDYNPGNVWVQTLQLLGYEVAKLPSAEMAVWSQDLDQYALVMFAALYEADPGAELVNWSDMGAELAAYIQGGGLVIMEGVRADEAPVDWLTSVNASWALTVNSRLSGLPEWIDPALLNPHALPDGPEVNAYIIGRIPNPAAPDYANGGISVSGGKVLARNRNNTTTIWTDTLGSGRIIVTTYFNGYALDRYLLENVLAWSTGSGYEPVFEEGPTIAQQVAGVNPAGTGSSPITVTVNSDGVLEIDGSRFFPFGFYAVHDSSTPILSANGFNFSMSGNTTAWVDGLRSTYDMNHDDSALPTEIENDITDQALIMRNMGEEPSNWTDAVTNYKFMYRSAVASKLDPNRPSFVLVNNPAVFEGFVEIGEISAIDPYTVKTATSSLSRIARDIDAVEEITLGKPVFTLLQAHFDEGNLSWPTNDQLRGEMYVALAAGAKGISWFAFDGTDSDGVGNIHREDGSFQEPQWSTLRELADEFADIEDFITGSDDTVSVSVVSPGSGVYTVCFTRTASPEHLLVVASSESFGQAVTLSWPLDVAGYTALWDSPSISVDTLGDQITLSLSSYQRGAYTFDE